MEAEPSGQIRLMDEAGPAASLEHTLTLVTRNVKDLAALGVTLLNLWEPN